MLLLAFIVAMAIQYVLFLPAYFFKTDKLTDLSYGISFIALALIFFKFSTGKLLLVGIILLWAIRLIMYLVIRIHHMKRDKRFDGMRESLPRFLKFWTLQGVAVFLIMLAPLIYLEVGTSFSIVGLLVSLLGLGIETIADHQKFMFKKRVENKDCWTDTGLWRYSRHPNYLGEMLVWIGIYIFIFPGLSVPNRLIAAISPLFITGLLLFVSGIPLLEKRADEKWGKNKKYLLYTKRTPVLIPYQTLVLSIGLCLCAGALGGLFTTTGADSWYASIVKPSFNPPNWVFGPVWTLLYILMGVALYLAIRQKASWSILAVFMGQLALNALWSILFFGLESPVLALVCIIVLWVSILTCIILFYKQSRAAAYLLLPYLLWVSFATILNWAIWLLN
jgi:tryptophan-rich sensory protein